MPALRTIHLSKLQWALAASVAVHGALLALKAGAPQTFNRMFYDTPLSVVLVNQSTLEAPDKPQALAQVNLAGGGDAQQGLATTPLPATAAVAEGNALENQARALAREEQRQRELVTRVKSQLVQLQRMASQQTKADAQALEDRRQRLLDLLGAIERRIEQQNTKPRRRFVGPNTRSVPYAVYYDKMRQKIEHLGTTDFPEQAGRKLYGKLIMAITVDASGRLVKAEVVRSSGDLMLDRMARAIVDGAQPFGHFNASMRRDADQIVIIAAFNFTRESGLETQMRAQPQDALSKAP